MLPIVIETKHWLAIFGPCRASRLNYRRTSRAFVRDMNAYFAETNLIKRDEIAIRQLVALNEYLGRRERPLRVIDVQEMFLQMKDQA